MRLTTMTYNLMRVCEEISKIQDPDLVHPSDKKILKRLKKDKPELRKVAVLLIHYCFWIESHVSAHIPFEPFRTQNHWKASGRPYD